MLLLWQNNVPVSIEVLLCSNCRVSQQKVRSVEFSTIPEPGSILLEQWTVSIVNSSNPSHLISSQGLFQAVRSYLHFSQLSAWYSNSKGQEPKNVLYRITIPGETFSSKFSCKPEEHTFPSASKSFSRYLYQSGLNPEDKLFLNFARKGVFLIKQMIFLQMLEECPLFTCQFALCPGVKKFHA